MAQIKTGIDYYAHNVGMTRDRRLRAMRRKFGSSAVDVWFALLDMTYSTSGYYLVFDGMERENVLMDIAQEISCKDSPDEESIDGMIKSFVEIGLLDSGLYEMGILSSAEIQEQYYMSTLKRAHVEVDTAYWLLTYERMLTLSPRNALLAIPNAESIFKHSVSIPNDSLNSHSDVGIEQSKVKKSKEKKSRVKEKKAEESKAAPAREEYGDSDMLPPDIGYIPPPADEYFPEVDVLAEDVPEEDVPEEGVLEENMPEVNVPEEYDFSLDEIAERNPALARSLSNMTIVMPDGSEVSARDYQPQGDNEVRREAARQREREARQAEREAQQHSQEQERRQKEQEALNTALTLSAMKGNIPDISERLWAICDSASQAAGEFERKHGSWEQVEAQREAQRIASGEVTLVTLTPPPSTPERDALVKCYGEYNVARYEQKFRSWAERSRRDASEMYPRITKWMAEDLGRK